jgi:hypothetical protein
MLAGLGEVPESGRSGLPAKKVTGELVRGFKSHPLRQAPGIAVELAGVVTFGDPPMPAVSALTSIVTMFTMLGLQSVT